MTCEIYALGRAGRALRLSLKTSPLTDILFLTVPDNQIVSVAQKLATQGKLPAIIAHVSGAYSYQILKPLQGKTALAQFHPLAALTGLEAIPKGSLCAISSDQPWAQQILTDLAQDMGLIPVSLNPDKTTQYHAAAVLTGNLTLGLVRQSISLMKEAGIAPKAARLGLSKLLHSVADNIYQQDILEALTGPVARKDTQTIQKHLEILQPEVKQVYQILSNWLST
ncbi:MAG: Rossmann-like and DUF2520 domain-containing protein [Myxococcaceae bacterium]